MGRGDALATRSIRAEFTSTLKDSQDADAWGGANSDPSGHSFDGTNTLTASSQVDKIFIISGQWTTTVKDSETFSGVDSQVRGSSTNGTDTLWCGETNNKLHRHSGKITSTFKDSQALPGTAVDPTDTTTTDYNSRLNISAAAVFSQMTGYWTEL